MASLSLKHIYKVYPNGVKAVSDFCMEIADKEFIVFVGPSGCGKSTMLRMIAGLEDISAGELSIGDTVVNDVEPKDRDVAMVFQNYALYPHMSVYENIAFGLRVRKMSNAEIHERVLQASEILGIKDYLDRKPKEMSGGQRQRVSLGRAIVRDPKVMLLDEPLSNLDAKLRTQMRAEILKLHAKLNTTFIYVTHDQVEAMTMGTRIVVMKNGFVQQIDTPKNLYLYPGNKFVAGFIGTPQMSFFEGTMTKNGDKVEQGDGYVESSTRVIIKAGFQHEYLAGQVYEAAINIDRMHFFDKETEETIVPRLPEVNDVDCEVKNGKMHFLGTSLPLPPALVSCPEGKGNMLLPSNALRFDGELKAKVVSCEQILGKYLVSLELGGRRLFAVTDEPKEVGAAEIGIDCKRITLNVGEAKFEPMEELVRFEGTFEKKKEKVDTEVRGKIKKKDAINFYLGIQGQHFPAPEFIAKKVFATLAPREVFSSPFYYDFTPYDVTIGKEGVPGTVESIADYGDEKFAKVRVGDKVVCIRTDSPVSGQVCLTPDFDKAGVVEAKRGIKLI